MEGYYDDCIFNRVVKDFIVQTGDPSGIGGEGESIYGKPFPNEIHSRIKFAHRGIVAMASGDSKENNSEVSDHFLCWMLFLVYFIVSFLLQLDIMHNILMVNIQSLGRLLVILFIML